MLVPDRELMERARRGDGAAAGELFSRYWRAARAAAFGVTGEFASTEDAAAEAFRHAWADLPSLRDPDRFGPWLRRIVVRKARLGSRGHHAAADDTLDELPAAQETADEVLERLQLAALVQQLVRDLPPRLREAVSLFYFEGYETDSAARFLEIPPGTIRRRLHEARLELRSAADHILERRKSMIGQHEREIQRLRELLDKAGNGEAEAMYQMFRVSLALRPVPKELMSEFVRRRRDSVRQPDERGELSADVRAMAQHFSGPSDRACNPEHPVGAVAASIRRALPSCQEWTLDVAAAAASPFFLG